MVPEIFEIILGLVIWQLVPGWITQGNKKAKDIIKLACNIIGIIMVLAGCYSMLMTIF